MHTTATCLLLALPLTALTQEGPEGPFQAELARQLLPDPIQLALTSVEVPSRIDEVTVYPDSALVRRTALRPAGATEVFLRDLPASLDPDSLRVRVAGAELVTFELLPSNQAASPDARLAELQAELETLRAGRRAIEDELSVVQAIEGHLRRQLSSDPSTKGPQGAELVQAWRETLPFLRAELEKLAVEKRGLEARAAESREREAALELELGALARGGASVRDLRLELVELAPSAGEVTVEYIVQGARWTPSYDLRSSAAMDRVELVHRARVWQASGEDWSDVELVLSTARPRRGAQGPEPQPRWVSLGNLDRYSVRGSAAYDGDIAKLGYAEDVRAFATPAVVEASTETSGLHLRYRLPRRETVASRPDPTSVLLGRRQLDVELERYCVPAVDPTVWVRGRTTNDTGWTLLPGPVAVHVGEEYLGQAQLGQVIDGDEFDLALGLDPRLTVERVLVEDDLAQPGIFGSKVERTRSWRVRAANGGDDPVEVVLFEALPRANDERIEVRFDRADPKPATGERFDRLREEQGVVTFRLRIPAGDEATASWRTRVAWPESQSISGL